MILFLIVLFLSLTAGDIVTTLKLSKYYSIAKERNPVIRGLFSCGKFWVVVWMVGVAIFVVVGLCIAAKSGPTLAVTLLTAGCVLRGWVVWGNVKILRIVKQIPQDP